MPDGSLLQPLHGFARLRANGRLLLVSSAALADRLRAALPDASVVAARPTGYDLTPLAGRTLVADDEDLARAALAAGAATAGIVDQSVLTDALDAGAAGDALQAAIRAAARKVEPAAVAATATPVSTPAPAPAPHPHDVPPEEDRDTGGWAPPIDEEDDPYRCLGFNRGHYFYLSFGQRQIVTLTANGHTKNALLAIAPLHHWERVYPGGRGCSWEAAINALMQRCHLMGVFDPIERTRGRGAWWDDGRAVLHMGDRLIVDGEPVALERHQTKYVYEALPPLGIDAPRGLLTKEAHRLLDLTSMFRWERPISARLLAGWCVIAPICGALKWRPHIWITSPAGSGKTTVMDEVVKPMLGGLALPVMSVTSEAGVRQKLESDARPVVFDEAEQEDLASRLRMRGVLYLARAASAETGADIIKGSQTQSGARSYRIRSCFAFSSINVGIEHYADETRITVLTLEKIDGSSKELRDTNAEHWEKLKALIAETINPTFAAGMLARSLQLLPVIRDNAEVFAEAAAAMLGNRRIGDQLGAMLAGAYSLHSTQRIDIEAAKEWIGKHDWEEHTAASAERDEHRLLSTILQEVVRVSISGQTRDRTVGELLEVARSNFQTPEEEALLRLGIRPHDDGFYVSTTHKQLKHLLRETPWAAGWRRALLAIDGARKAPGKGNINFGGKISTPAIWVPYAALERDG